MPMDLLAKTPQSFRDFVSANQQIYDNVISQVVDTPISPPAEDIFNAFQCYDNVRVVLIGQDPYPTNAHGYSFSSTKTIPPSLKVIYKCLLKANLITKMPSHGNLTSWADQGVLLLNAALTCEIGKSNSHAKAWSIFTSKVIASLDLPDIVFICLGGFAIKSCSTLKSAHVLTWGHPSPLNTVNRDETNPKAFINATVFADANAYLASRLTDPINWDSINSI